MELGPTEEARLHGERCTELRMVKKAIFHRTALVHKPRRFVISQTIGEELTPRTLPQWDAKRALADSKLNRSHSPKRMATVRVTRASGRSRSIRWPNYGTRRSFTSRPRPFRAHGRSRLYRHRKDAEEPARSRRIHLAMAHPIQETELNRAANLIASNRRLHVSSSRWVQTALPGPPWFHVRSRFFLDVRR